MVSRASRIGRRNGRQEGPDVSIIRGPFPHCSPIAAPSVTLRRDSSAVISPRLISVGRSWRRWGRRTARSERPLVPTGRTTSPERGPRWRRSGDRSHSASIGKRVGNEGFTEVFVLGDKDSHPGPPPSPRGRETVGRHSVHAARGSRLIARPLPSFPNSQLPANRPAQSLLDKYATISLVNASVSITSASASPRFSRR